MFLGRSRTFPQITQPYPAPPSLALRRRCTVARRLSSAMTLVRMTETTCPPRWAGAWEESRAVGSGWRHNGGLIRGSNTCASLPPMTPLRFTARAVALRIFLRSLFSSGPSDEWRRHGCDSESCSATPPHPSWHDASRLCDARPEGNAGRGACMNRPREQLGKGASIPPHPWDCQPDGRNESHAEALHPTLLPPSATKPVRSELKNKSHHGRCATF